MIKVSLITFAIDCRVSIVKVGKKQFRESEKKRVTDGQTDGWTDGLTDRQMDTPSYRNARTHLKMRGRI